MDGLWWKSLHKWMIWGYHYFWKHPYAGQLGNLTVTKAPLDPSSTAGAFIKELLRCSTKHQEPFDALAVSIFAGMLGVLGGSSQLVSC